MLRRIRGHGNFAEYVPLTLILIGFLEISGQSKWIIHILGSMLFFGRLMHGYAFAFTDEYVFGRSSGAALTFLALGIASILCLYSSIVNL